MAHKIGFLVQLTLIVGFFTFSHSSVAYNYFTTCEENSKSKCYKAIVYSCNELYPENQLDAQTQFNRMGCLTDSMMAKFRFIEH